MMQLPRKAVTIIPIVLFIILGMFSACEDRRSVDSKAVEKSRYVIDTLMAGQNIPGLQIAVWQGGNMVFSKGFGYADLELNVPVEPNTKMRIGSVSKTLTSAAVGKLYEQGKLDLEAPVQEYVSYFPEKEYPINIRQVAGHTAGIRHYKGEEFLMNKRFESVQEGVEIFDEDTLLFKPGTDYSYSSYGWNLISAVVEGAADTTFLSYMNNEVFLPLGMDETEAEYTDSLVYNRTSYYSKGENGGIINAPRVDNSYKWAGGGFIGTAEDLITFGKNIFWGNFLQSETVEILTEPQELESGENIDYGIGWQIGNDDEDRRYYGHSGGSVGGSTRFVVFPEQKVIVAVIANVGGVSYRDAHLNIADFFMDGETGPSK
jgi:CubicO group peptidase (beta-lactamase class C family)